MLKKISLLLILLSLFLAHNVNAEKITLGYVDFPPYEFEEQDQPKGILVSIVKKVFKKAEIPLELNFMPFKRAYELTKSGRIDGLFNFYKTENRLQHFDYSKPIINNPLVFFVRKDADIQFNKLEDLKGLKIGVMRGYTYGKAFDTSSLFSKDASNSHESNLKKVLYGRIDAYPCDKLVGIYTARKHKIMSELKILTEPLKVMKGHIGFTKGKHKDVIEKIDKVITQMLQNGKIDEAIDQYIKEGW